MNDGMTLDKLSTLAETVDLECKAAQGRDGRGELPDDFWKSYCGMANSDGGVIWLGIQEKTIRRKLNGSASASVGRMSLALSAE